MNGDDTDDTKVAETLVKLLDESDLLQELMSNNALLLEFLRKDKAINILIDLMRLESLGAEEINESLRSLSLIGAEGIKSADDGKDEVGTVADAKTSESENEAEVAATDDGEQDEEKREDDTFDSDSDTSRDDFKDASDSVDEQDDETPEERRNRYATLAAEILSADVWSLTDTVMELTKNLNRLWLILDLEPPLLINLATYFMKIMEHLLDMKCEEMVTYLIDNQPNLVENFMKHLANPPLMDFLLKLISTDKLDNSTGIIDFLQEQRLIPRLLDALDSDESGDPEVSLVRQSSAADFLKALITISANSTTDNSTIGPNELTRELVSEELMTRLCDIMLKGGYALGNGVGIIIEIIRKNNSDYDILPVLYITIESHPPTGRDPIYLGHLLRVFGSNIHRFNELLLNSNTGSKLKTTFGEIEPLGFERFKICELIAELLHCSNMALLNDNKGFAVVRIRDELRQKLKQIDPVGFKYNEVIEITQSALEPYLESENELTIKFESKRNNHDKDFNDTIDSFNSSVHDVNDGDDDEPHANTNLSEEEIRLNPVVGDFLKIAMYDTQIVLNILAMFFKFSWNNFLHNVVFDIVQQILNGLMDIGFNKYLAIDIFHLGDITHKITEGQQLCNEFEAEHSGLRLGYMGHLTLIAEEVVKFIQLYPVSTVSHLVDERIEDSSWESYVSDVLFDTRKKYNAILGGSDVEDDEGSNTFDESQGEVIEDADFDLGIGLDPTVDHDLIGSDYDDNKAEEFHEDVDAFSNEHDADTEKKNSSRSSLSDDSESDEESDKIDDYISNVLKKSGAKMPFPMVAKVNEGSDTHNYLALASGDDEGDDDYIDPNDDGLSYRKSNSLYDAHGLLVTDHLLHFADDDKLANETSSSSSSSDDDEDTHMPETTKERSKNKLTRSASKG